MEKTGIVFICPIIGLTRSLKEALSYFTEKGFPVEMVDIFDAEYPRSFWKVAGLTALPGAPQRRIDFGNAYNEKNLFSRIYNSINRLQEQGCSRIILGGMSGGFVFASRIAQLPHDDELDAEVWSPVHKSIAGVFGVSPLLFYPEGVSRKRAHIERVPSNIPIVLVWGEHDDIIPEGTIEHGLSLAKEYPHITADVLRRNDFKEAKKVRHQFFGGKDYIGFLRNIFWHPTAEKKALALIESGLCISIPD